MGVFRGGSYMEIYFMYYSERRSVLMKLFYREAEEFYRSRGWGLKMGFGERPAIIVIDLCKAWFDKTHPLGSDELDYVINNTIKILEVGRDAKVPIFFTKVAFDAEGCEKFGPRQLKFGYHRNKNVQVRGTSELELDPRLKRRPDEIIIYKQRPSAFWGTPFVDYLIGRKIDTLIITGVSTSGCICATASDAINYNFYSIVVREAVGDRCKMAHEVSLINIDLRYADVISMDEVISYLSKKKKKNIYI